MNKRILIVSPVECYPAYSGNSVRIGSFTEQLQALGHEVHFLHLADRHFDPDKMIHHFGDRYIYRPFRYLNEVRFKLVIKAVWSIITFSSRRLLKIDDFLRSRDIGLYKNVLHDVQPDIVLINYAYYSKLFEFTPAGIYKILDAHDSVWLRYMSIYRSETGYRKLSIDARDEIDCLNRADTVVCIQEHEEKYLSANGCTARLVTIGHAGIFSATSVRNERRNLLYIASDFFTYKNDINAFLSEIWPALKINFPDIHLYIAGRVGLGLDGWQKDSGITVLGVVGDLDSLYNMADVFINPVKAGSGLKIKNVEALFKGKPVVTTVPGKEGLEIFENKGLLVCHGPGDWINYIGQLFNDTEFYNEQIFHIKNGAEHYNNENTRKFAGLFN